MVERRQRARFPREAGLLVERTGIGPVLACRSRRAAGPNRVGAATGTRSFSSRRTAGATLDVQPPELLPIAAERDVTGWRYTYDVVEAGQRFLAIRSAAADPAPPNIVMVNWAAALRK